MTRAQQGRVSLAMIAGEAGVSVSTVSRIANGHLNRANPRTVERVQTLLAGHGYRPDNIGRSLQRGESRIVAMLVSNLNNPAMGAIASSTEAALRAAGYVMILCDTHDEPALQDEYLLAMRAQSVQGYVVVSPVRSPMLGRFLEAGEPVVLVGRRQPHIAKPAPFVGIDNRAAGALAAKRLLALGVQRPAIIHTALTSTAIADRVAGFLDELGRHGLFSGDVMRAGSDHLQHLDAGYAAARTLTARGWPDGLFCVSDLMAYGAYRHACESGIAVPETCRFVGVDGSPLNQWIAPWLSSVHVPYAEFGPAVLSQLQATWAGREATDFLLPYRLVTPGAGP